MTPEKLNLEKLTQPTQPPQEGSSDMISLLAISELLDNAKIKTISRIKPEQTPNLAKLYLFADTFDTSFTRSLADTILQLQISINGLGRKEMVQLVQRRIDDMVQVQPIRSKDIFR